MKAERIVLEAEEKEFIEMVTSFVTEKGWTISNLQNAVSEVEDYMKKNATLTELTIGMPAQIDIDNIKVKNLTVSLKE
ncbi:MAG: hypothetical protein KIC96_16225 [Enterococcus casseliflavus]|uniref:hypothetical protein n=1 Tax=Enterococcus casseliflavus TaxID=37734 RepID=UPI003D6BAFDE|nr:hypothetical protein [Enterococcus casseliflavus]